MTVSPTAIRHLGYFKWEYTPTFRGFDSFLGCEYPWGPCAPFCARCPCLRGEECALRRLDHRVCVRHGPDLPRAWTRRRLRGRGGLLPPHALGQLQPSARLSF